MTWLVSSGSFVDWLKAILLDTRLWRAREFAAIGVYSLCTSTPLINYASGQTHAIVDVHAPIHALLLDKLLPFLDELSVGNLQCEQYFVLVSELVRGTFEGASAARDFSELFQKLARMVTEHPVVETRHATVEDKHLSGMVNLMRVLASKDMRFKQFAHDEGLLDELLDNCLFRIPTAEQLVEQTLVVRKQIGRAHV